MKTIVMVKRVPDPEAQSAAFRIAGDGSVAVSPEVSRVISPYDESALEAALQLRDAQGGKVALISLGKDSGEDFLCEAMATGADEAYLVSDKLFQGGDGFATAYVLSRAISRIGGYDLILCGRQASDTDAGIVGPAVAEALGLPCATVVRKVEVAGDKLKVERVIEDGVEVMEIPRPALLTMTSELYTLRYAGIPDIMAAAERPVTVWSAGDLGIAAAELAARGNRSVVERHFIPLSQTKCEVIGGENIEAAAGNLARALRGRKVI